MIKSKKQMYLVIGAFALVLMLGTVTYAFFNYTRTGATNTIRTGRIAFNSTQGNAINLTNVFPIDVTNGIPNNNANVGSVTINVTGDTTYTDGIEYLVSAVNVQNTIGSGANAKTVPISIDVSVASNTNNDPATTLGTADSDYFTNRGSSANTSIYKVLAGDVIANNDQLVVGYIKSGATGVDGNIVIRAYLDASKIAISDTYDGNETDNMGTTTNWVNDRETFTTEEWNALQTNGVSFQVKVESNEGIWLEAPTVTINFNANGGTVSPTSNNIMESSATYGNLPTPSPNEGYYFDGWYTDQTGGTKVDSSTSYVNGISPTTLYAHWILLPTTIDDMCPNCVFMYTENIYNYGANGSTILDIENNGDEYYNNYLDLVNNNSRVGFNYYFLGFILDNDRIDRAFACAKKLNSPNEGKYFCIEGTTDGSKVDYNKAILNSSNLWNNTCSDYELYHVFSCGEYGEPAISSAINNYGVSTGDGVGDSCEVLNNGTFDCVLQ